MTALKRYCLSDCCEIISGATPKTSNEKYWDGDICWVTPKDLSHLEGHYITDTPRKITATGLKSCSADILPVNSVLFSSRAPIGHVAINTVPMATNQGFKSFVPKKGIIDEKFLFHWLRANRAYLESLGNGATFKEVSKATVARVEIPLPSLQEQRRIAAILDQADTLRAKRREALAELDKLAQSIFVEMFGDPQTNPQNWTRIPLGDVALKITDGEHLNPEFSLTGMPIVMAGNVLEDSIDIANAKLVDSALGERFRKKCGPVLGDLLVVSRGATIGRMCAVNVTDTFCLMGSVILIKLQPNKLETAFLSALLKHPVMRSALYKTSGSSAQQAIYLKDLKSLLCIVPPLKIQKQFSEKISSITPVKSAHNSSLNELDELFASLQHRAFRGEL